MPEVFSIRLPTALQVYIGVFGVVWCGFVAVGFVSLVPRPVALVPLGMLAFGGTLMFRMLRLEVVADGAGLLIRNYYKTQRYEWRDVEDFRLGGPKVGMPFGKVIHVLLANGEIVTLDVTMRPWLCGRAREQLDRYLRRLREWVAQG